MLIEGSNASFVSNLRTFLILMAMVSLCPCIRSTAQIPGHSTLTIAEREKLARPILLQAESASKSLDPSSRSILLYRTAGAWLALNPAHAISLYRSAFKAARESNPVIRENLEEEILNDLLPVSPSTVLELLLNAAPETKEKLYSASIRLMLFQGNYSSASRAFYGAVASGVLPVEATVNLLASLPDNQYAERERIFSAAILFYQGHPDSESYHWTLAELVGDFYAQFPSTLVLKAVNIVLSQAEKHESGGSTSAQYGAGVITFHSSYDYQLFAVVPALRQVDPNRAAQLLSQHPEVAANIKRFPAGLVSLGVDSKGVNLAVQHDELRGMQIYNTVKTTQELTDMDLGLEFTIPRDPETLRIAGATVLYVYPDDPETAIIGQTGNCPSDVAHRLELAQTVAITVKVTAECSGPLNHQWCGYNDTFPRAKLIQAIAERCTYERVPAAARLALETQLELINRIPAEHRIKFLAVTADLYLRLGDRKAAAEVVSRGFHAARAIYDRDAHTEGQDKFPKGVWPSAEAYRSIIALGVNADLKMTRDVIERIPDPALAELERTMLARALLGVPVRRYMVFNGNGTSYQMEREETYDSTE
jgi:hypothetical protein